MRQHLAYTVGKIIARRRAALNMTQEQLSVAIDVDPMTISRFERGVTLPSLVTVQRLSGVFGISIGDFFDESVPDARADGEAVWIAALLGSLKEGEREFIIDTLKRFCTFRAVLRDEEMVAGKEWAVREKP